MHPFRAAAVATLAILAFAPSALSQTPAKLHWLHTPTLDDVKRVYPPDALGKGISGGSMVGCDVAPDGELLHCKAYAESPANIGFGDAGVKFAAYFRMAPDSVASLPVAGRIALPMVFGAPGRPSPKLPFQLSDSALLLTNFDGARGAGGTTNVDCLAAPAPRKCDMHFVTWAARPNAMTVLAATLRAGKTSGSDLAICWVGAAGALTDCRASAPEATRLMGELAPGLVAPPRADDRTPVGDGPIMITLNWTALSIAAQALHGDAATAKPADGPH
jgi:hypothetical protein